MTKQTWEFINASFLTVLALSAAATVANIKVRYDVKTPQFAIFGAHVTCSMIFRKQPLPNTRTVIDIHFFSIRSLTL